MRPVMGQIGSPQPSPPSFPSPLASSSPSAPSAPSLPEPFFPPFPPLPPPLPPPPATNAPGFMPGGAGMLGTGAVLAMTFLLQDTAREDPRDAPPCKPTSIESS